MKVGILTFHRAYNYGALLQCYALNKTISDMGVDCEVIDYAPSYFREYYYMKKKFRISHPPVKTWIRRLLLHNVIKKRNDSFIAFLRENIKLTSQCYHTAGQLDAADLPYDVYITGSDQVWNDACACFDPVFFLQFRNALSKKRVSYAASFGFNTVPPALQQEYQARLQGFDAYSVREESGRDILRGLLGKEASVCCDPVFLLQPLQWEDIADKIPDREYILLYYTFFNERLHQFAQKLSKAKNMKVISVPCNIEYALLSGKTDARYGFEVRSSNTPGALLALFQNASYVLTNSFHGTAFSIVFRKPFWTAVYGNAGRTNGRALELLEKVGLCNRTLDKADENMDAPVHWDTVAETLGVWREESLCYLRKALDLALYGNRPVAYTLRNGD